MRILVALAVVMVTGCSDMDAIVADGPDSGASPDENDIIQWVDNGRYAIEWESEFDNCAELRVLNSTLFLDWCGVRMKGSALGNCRRYVGADAYWHLCPNVGSLYGEIRASNEVVASFRAVRF